MRATQIKHRLGTLMHQLRRAALAPFYLGDSHYCPICNRTSDRFRAYGDPPRPGAQCVHCGALERHRLLWVFLERHTNLLQAAGKKLLHVAPEPCLEPRLRELLGAQYVTADLHDPRVTINIDVTEIPFEDGSFDMVYCSHVLEHVLDDRKAMREFRRILKEDGWAILLVPITSDRTFEDPTIVDPRQRRIVFGQKDHVRRYGPDYVERLREAGFKVRVFSASDLTSTSEAERLGLSEYSGDIYFCTR